jgi:RES domain-containing protein
LTIQAWRLLKARHADDAFNGEGASRFPGRWNHRGTPVVYTAASLSLAALETLANLDDAALLTDYICVPVSFGENLCHTLEPKRLPRDWRANPAPSSTRDLGTAWAKSGMSCILKVPSAIIPRESNFLINPLHPDFSRLKVGKAEQFSWDPRLVQ